MRPIQTIKNAEKEKIKFVLTDIDDTLTNRGQVLPEPYSALWKLHESGKIVIAVTGRPAGWCDLIARQWPVDGVIGENGAFAFYMGEGKMQHLFHPDVASPHVIKKLDDLRQKVLSAIPGTKVAKDQFSRMFDLAIDFQEEEPFLPLVTAQNIKSLCEKEGAQAKVSSIHVNAWFGEYNKLSMVKIFLKSRWGVDVIEEPEQVFYCGDSPNDEPMFEHFPYSCAVANIKPYLSMMKYHPQFITLEENGFGFTEAIECLLARTD
jgi:HAD superfamily hydrolase (TIGR01484 family)